MFSFKYESKIIEYKLIRSNRKTVTISILPTKVVVVKTPRYLSDKEIMSMVKKKAKWIDDKISNMPDYMESKLERRYVDGEKFLYRGKEYKLKIIEDTKVKKTEILKQQDEIIVIMNHVDHQKISILLQEWYKEKAKELVIERINYYNTFINKKITGIKIKNQRKRWGSCSSLGNLNFNWRIIMMPDEIFDYIVVHEMCHLLYLNHSKDYWGSVEKILPDYQTREQWIKINGMKLL